MSNTLDKYIAIGIFIFLFTQIAPVFLGLLYFPALGLLSLIVCIYLLAKGTSAIFRRRSK